VNGGWLMVDTSPYGDATLRLRIAKGDAMRTVPVVAGFHQLGFRLLFSDDAILSARD
jgi:hypothetical protein